MARLAGRGSARDAISPRPPAFGKKKRWFFQLASVECEGALRAGIKRPLSEAGRGGRSVRQRGALEVPPWPDQPAVGRAETLSARARLRPVKEAFISEPYDSLHMAGQSEAKAQAKPTTPGAAGPRGAAGASWVL